MRVIVSAAYGTLGDLAPMLALAEALVQGDHTVVLVCDEYFRVKAQAVDGLSVVTVGSAEDYAATLVDAETRWRKPQTLVYAWLSRLKQHYEVLARLLAEAPKTTVFVGHSLDLAVKLIEETKRVPCATVVLQPWMLRSKAGPSSFHGMRVHAWYPRWAKATCFKLQDALIDFAYCPQLNAFRKELGLAPVKRVYHRFFLCKELCIGMFPAALASFPDWPKQLRLVGFPLADAAPGGGAADAEAALQQLPDALRSFVECAKRERAPLFAFTLGTAPPPYARAVFKSAVAACGAMGARAVLLCGVQAVLPAELPPHAHAAAYAPFSALLRHVDVFCFNGGIGGVSQALRAGVPQLIVPGRFDQPDNSDRMVRLGVAARLDAAEFTPARCAAALTALHSSEHVRTACAVAAKLFESQAREATPSAAEQAAALVAAMLPAQSA